MLTRRPGWRAQWRYVRFDHEPSTDQQFSMWCFMLRLQLANSIRAQKAVEEGDASAVAGGDHKLSAQRETVSRICV